MLQNNPEFLSKVVNADEIWIYRSQNQTAAVSVKESNLHLIQRNQDKWRAMSSPLLCFFDNEGIIHKKFVPLHRPINTVLYPDILRMFKENMRRKHPKIPARTIHSSHLNNTWAYIRSMCKNSGEKPNANCSSSS